VLAPEVAPPTPEPAANTDNQPAQPSRLIIPAIGLDLEPMPVGLDENRVPIVPKHDVGWFEFSSMPGAGSNVVFWGHVLRWRDSPEIPAPFARVHELQPGAELRVTTVEGRERIYHVTQQVWARPDEVQYVRPTSTERVTLVSCIGDNVIMDGTLTKEFRLITIAEPVER
jgi:sortase (surface protein transpeptidase)